MPPGSLPIGFALAGTLAGVLTDAAPGALWALALVLASLALLPKEPTACRGLLLAGLAAAAAGHAGRTRDGALHAPLAVWLSDEAAASVSRRPVTILGRLAEDATPTENGARLLVDVRALEHGEGSFAIAGRVQVSVGGAFVRDRLDEWRAGRRVTLPATLRHPQVLHNPGGWSPRWQTLTRPFALVASAKSAMVVRAERGRLADEVAAEIRARVRRGVTRAFARVDGATAARSTAIVTAILIGDRAGLDSETESTLRAAGTFHLIAISGGNVALVMLLALACTRLVVRAHVPTLFITLIVVAAYGWVVGGDPSVSRAVTAACLYLVLSMRGLRTSPTRAIGIVAVAIVVVDPLAIVDVGAWLSFAATLGIVLLAARVSDGVLPVLGFRFPGGIVMRWFVVLAAATVGAELALLPIHAVAFNRLGVAGVLLNLVAMPAMALVQVSGAFAVACTNVSPTSAGLFAWVAHVSAVVLVDSGRLVDLIPWLSWRVPAPGLVAVCAYYIALILVLLPAVSSRPGLAKTAKIATGMAALYIALAPMIEVNQPRRGWLRLTVLDVGQGDALVLQLPTGDAALIDAGGGSSGFDIGDRVIAPALWKLGVRDLTWLAVTHPDLDHIGGALTTQSIFRPREIWEGIPLLRDESRTALRDAAGRAGVSWRRLQTGDELDAGDVALSVLSPPLPDWERQRTRNDDSLVLRVTYRDVELLLTGDIGIAVERALGVSATRPLRILKVAHHGSRGSSSPEFLVDYRPHIAVVSVGGQNLFGHPAPEVVERFAAVGADFFRTDRHGAVIFETDGREVRVRTMTGLTRTVRALVRN